MSLTDRLMEKLPRSMVGGPFESVGVRVGEGVAGGGDAQPTTKQMHVAMRNLVTDGSEMKQVPQIMRTSRHGTHGRGEV